MLPVRQPRRLDGPQHPLGVGLGLPLIPPGPLLRLGLQRGLLLIPLRFPHGLGLGAHPVAGSVFVLRPWALQTARPPAAHLVGMLQVVPEEAVSPFAGFSVRALHLWLPPPPIAALFQEHIRHITGDVRGDQRQALLQILRQPCQGVGRLLREPVLLEQQKELRGLQLLPNDLQPGQFRRGHLTRRRHLVPHPARELVALLPELVEQQLHPLRLLGKLRVGQHPGSAVGKNELELRHGRAPVPPHGAGHLPQVLPGVLRVLRQQAQGGTAPVAAEEQVFPRLVRVGRDQGVLLEAVHGDGIRQGLQLRRVHPVEIGLVVQNVLQGDQLDTGRGGSCVQIGHGFHQAGQVEFPTHFPVPSPGTPPLSAGSPSSRRWWG